MVDETTNPHATGGIWRFSGLPRHIASEPLERKALLQSATPRRLCFLQMENYIRGREKIKRKGKRKKPVFFHRFPFLVPLICFPFPPRNETHFVVFCPSRAFQKKFDLLFLQFLTALSMFLPFFFA